MQFSFNVGGQSGPDYAIETSTNLTQWSTVFTSNSPELPFILTDTNSARAAAILPSQTRPSTAVKRNWNWRLALAFRRERN